MNFNIFPFTCLCISSFGVASGCLVWKMLWQHRNQWHTHMVTVIWKVDFLILDQKGFIAFKLWCSIYGAYFRKQNKTESFTLPCLMYNIQKHYYLLILKQGWKNQCFTVHRPQYILLPTYEKMFITCNCPEVCASQQQRLVISFLFSFTLIASISEDICISFHGSERTKYMYMW